MTSTKLSKIRLFFKGRTGVGLAIVTGWLVVAAFAPLITPYSPNAIDLSQTFAQPSLNHLLGTDNFGRDEFTRIVYGAQLTFEVLGIVGIISIPLGIMLGLISFFSRKIDTGVTTVIDIMLSVPGILFAILIVAGTGAGSLHVAVAVGIATIPYVARVTRSTIVSQQQSEYVEAAVTTGEGNISILRRYILPNSFQPIIVESMIRLGYSVVYVASLSFLGLGVQIPQAEWGALMVEGSEFLSKAPQLVFYPGLALVSLVMGFNLLGDGLHQTLPEVFRRNV